MGFFDYKELDPENYIHFKNKIVITKVDARFYEEALKEELKMWIKCDHYQEVFLLSVFYSLFNNFLFLKQHWKETLEKLIKTCHG